MGGDISRKSQVRHSIFSVQPSREKSVNKLCVCGGGGLSDLKTLINMFFSKMNHEGQQILNQLLTVSHFTP